MVSLREVRSAMMVGMRVSRVVMAVLSLAISAERMEEDVDDEAFNFAISAPILENSDCRDASASLIALASFWRRSRSFWGDWRRSF